MIALAYRAAPKNLSYSQLMVIPREEVEKELIFLGFLIMQNKLKAVTIKSIKELNDADIRTIMATGDNMLTAISVGRKCGIISETQVVYLGDLVGDKEVLAWKVARDSDEVMNEQIDSVGQDYKSLLPWESQRDLVDSDIAIAVTGKFFNKIVSDPSLLAIKQQVLLKGQIFSRMTPDDKARLVSELQNFLLLDIGMCGDGANDCNALKTADTGISLSDSEASIAAPFTSKV